MTRSRTKPLDNRQVVDQFEASEPPLNLFNPNAYCTDLPCGYATDIFSGIGVTIF